MKSTWHCHALSERNEIEQFLRHGTGSFFHEPAFLDYHPPEKFNFKNLVCRRDGKLIAWLPGHQEGKTYHSPAGASYGGPLWNKSSSLPERQNDVVALKDFLLEQGIREINLRLPPSFYFGDLGFILSGAGFSLSKRWGCQSLQLAGNEWP